MSENKEKFWVDDPSVLFSAKLFPTSDMTLDQKLNAITRLVLIGGAALYYLKYEHWYVVVVVGLLLVLIIKYAKPKENFSELIDADATNFDTDPVGTLAVPTPSGDGPLIENFTITPTYPSIDLHETTLSPIFAEEWQIPPPVYDLYVNTAPSTTFQEPLHMQTYPYGQYLTTTNLLPSDEQAIRMFNGGPRQAREYVNSAFTRNTLAHRENMTRLYKLRQSRRFRQNAMNDSFSPFAGY